MQFCNAALWVLGDVSAKESDFCHIKLTLSHFLQCSYEEQLPIEANLDFYNKIKKKYHQNR